ncbi:hypothetical protein EB093_04035 [bacterium]|nr:hypothetical protein [bacterium]
MPKRIIIDKYIAGFWATIFFPLEWLLGKLPTSEPTKLAIIRFDQLGDFLVNRVVVDSLKCTQRILLIVNTSVQNLAAIVYPDLEILAVDLPRFRHNPLYRLRTLFIIRRHGIRTIIHPVYSRHHFITDAEAVLRSTYTKNKIGFYGEDGYNGVLLLSRLTGVFYSQLVNTDKLFDGDKAKDLVTALGIKIVSQTEHTNYASPNSPIVIIPKPTSTLREWPMKNWITTIEFLLKYTSNPIVMCGEVPNEYSRGISSHFNEKIIDLSGKTTLSEFMMRLETSSLCIGIEGGGIHIAAYHNVKTIVITGGGHWGRFLPYPNNDTLVVANHSMPCYGCRWKCIYSGEEKGKCVSEISAEKIISIIKGVPLNWKKNIHTYS